MNHRYFLYKPRFFSKVCHSGILGQTEGLAGNSKPTHVCTRFVIIKVRNWIPACTVKTPLRYSALAWDELNFAEEP